MATTSDTRSAGDPFPGDTERIEIRVGELTQLFNSIDPSPFRQKDLDPNAEEFIVGWAREARRDGPLSLLVYVDRPGGPEDADILRDAVREFFCQRARVTRQRLRQLFRVGRTSLLIGLAFLAVSVGLGGALEQVLAQQRFGGILREGLIIGGWVAMWRPLETFLYDWWPIRAEARLYDRLSEMPVEIAKAHSGPPT
jgi:hypothetical protein